MLTTAISATLASINMTIWISVVSVIGSSITAWQEFSGTSKKLTRYAGAITKLRNLKIWWFSLNPVQKASAKNINYLVNQTEEVIMSDSKAWLATSQANKTLNKAVESTKN